MIARRCCCGVERCDVTKSEKTSMLCLPRNQYHGPRYIRLPVSLHSQFCTGFNSASEGIHALFWVSGIKVILYSVARSQILTETL